MLNGGEAGNIAVQIGEDGIMLVNAMRKGFGEQIARQLQTITDKPIRYIINTSSDLYYSGGNAELAAMGKFGATPNLAPGAEDGATIVSHENSMFRLSILSSQGDDVFPSAGVPRDVYFTSFKDIYFNDEPVFVMHEPNAHTDGDSIVLFRRSDTIAVGDLFTPGQYPVIDISRGGSVQGLISALNHLLDLAVPVVLQEGGTRIIPGRGRICNEADVVEFRNMVVIIHDRVRAYMDRGMTLEQIQTQELTLDYDTEFSGSGEGFIESIYQSLARVN
ncbi:MAG: hypothetical protein COA71_08975 [SAR86 cluster bacterium]|uniref:Metallo-beta-lactamase domain-containing protein n=1 Tax=SAR86 cluster bacterium TaxID=2030880 RepID=A0A2A5CCC2_9GAMM|nr:MAG: hypothetical protein COA71_08975 [SAR86 cluster bacterium]